MKIILAPDKFKGSMSAEQAAGAMARGVLSVAPNAEVDLCPLADGGEGFASAMAQAMQGHWQSTPVRDPLGRVIGAKWVMLPAPTHAGNRGECQGILANDSGHCDSLDAGPTAVIEMASAAGLVLLTEHERNPTVTSTFGVGQLIKAALDQGAKRILLGLGGSATCDGGVGMAQALGVNFQSLHKQHGPDTHPLVGGDLLQLTNCDTNNLDKRITPGMIMAACDVTNPLYGGIGAAAVYAPQKGATPAQVNELDQGLRHLAELVSRSRCENKMNTDDHIRGSVSVVVPEADAPGAGAAGGVGFGVRVFLKGELQRGIELVMQTVGLDERLKGCDLCFTGEGKLDSQSASGKVIHGVAQLAQAHGVKTWALAGVLDLNREQIQKMGLWRGDAIAKGMSQAESMRQAEALLETATAHAMRTWLADFKP